MALSVKVVTESLEKGTNETRCSLDGGRREGKLRTISANEKLNLNKISGKPKTVINSEET